MNDLLDDEITILLQLRRLPARLTVPQVAAILGFRAQGISVLVSRKLLRPLGKPVQNTTKYFASRNIEQLAGDSAWLGKATQTIAEYRQGRRKRNSQGTSHS